MLATAVAEQSNALETLTTDAEAYICPADPNAIMFSIGSLMDPISCYTAMWENLPSWLFTLTVVWVANTWWQNKDGLWWYNHMIKIQILTLLKNYM